MSKVSLSLQEKELTRFVASDKIGTSKRKLELKNLYLPLCMFPIFKDFPKFQHSIENIHNYLKNLLRYCSLFQLYKCENRFAVYFYQNNTWQQNDTESDMTIQLSSIKPDIKAVYTNINQCQYSDYFLLWKSVVNFHSIVYVNK